jgi:16S rRNA (cytosine967-C5)-methyltransferase
VRNAYPREWETILAAGNGRPAMTLRVNLRANSVAQYGATLQAAGLAYTQTGPAALHLERPIPVARLPGYAEGRVSVQDLGAQCAAPLLDVHAGMRVLDACAAPGGKTAHLLESADCTVTALDRDAQRLKSVADNLARLHLGAQPGLQPGLQPVLQLRAADAADLASWWDGTPYERVLLDAPCTASGIVRRHPDGKWLKRASDIRNLAGEQQRLLTALWQVLPPGGKLLYATCSIFPEENARHIGAFLSTHAEARLLAPDLALDHRDGQLLPKEQHDGFFYALLEKS